MSDWPKVIEPKAGDVETSLSAGSTPVICPGCQFDLRLLPIAARYCPKCGRDAHARISPPIPIGLSQELFKASSSTGGDSLLPRQVRSSILRGFAAALYRLGRRYESGLGTSNNQNEAQRCYYKAAKLGNLAAQRRLIDPDLIDERDSRSELPPA